MREVIEINGFEFTIRTDMDDYWDTSWLGEYSSIPGIDSIDRKLRGDQGYGEYRYFNPENTITEHRRGLSKLGYSKHEAHELAKSYVLRDYQTMENLNDSRSWFEILIIEVRYKGHKLGSASVGGILESDEATFKDYQNDLMREALKEAIDTLTALDTKPKTLAKAHKVAEDLKARAKEEYKENRRAYLRTRISRWRDLSHEYQNNRTRTRHAAKRIKAIRS